MQPALLPSIAVALKRVGLVFFPIVLIFCLIWFLGMFCIVRGYAENLGNWIHIGLLFVGMQPILSTCMAMTKADVRKYTIKMLTLSYIRTSLSEAER